LTRIGWLAVVVRVKNQRAFGARCCPFTINSGRRSGIGSFKQTRIQLAALHHRHDGGGVTANVFAITRHVGNSQQLDELSENFVLVPTTVFANGSLRERELGKEKYGKR
jgi:hypothetical protein